MSARIGGLCFGYGGLDLAVQQVIPDAELAWYAEFDKGASKIGAHRFPGVPNHGDMTAIDWSAVEPVDILTGGTPCQDLSHAGKRAGMTEGTRSNLWVAMRDAIATIKPSLVVWENVGGAYSAEATSELEPCPGCVGDGPGVSLRALGRVLGDLASLGFDAEWRGLRAADVGAPHGRLRIFVVAWPAADTSGLRRGARRGSRPREATRGWASADLAGRGDAPVSLLPTPLSHDAKQSGLAPSRVNRNSVELTEVALSLLPTPTTMDSHASGGGYNGQTNVTLTDATVRQPDRWGEYGAAIRRWERLTRLAPDPTEAGPKGSPRLSPRFSEWMMGLPDGWVTDVPGITRNEALKALGNGVVPQQAAAAIADALTAVEVAA